MRHPDKEMDHNEIVDVIGKGRLMTVAMSKDDEPYLVTANYAFDEKEECFYFHCAKSGKKIDYLRGNPAVWGQVMEDGGYVQGECEHKYRSVHFKGTASILDEEAGVKNALVFLIEQQEDDPNPVKKRNIETGKFTGAIMVRIDVDGFTGKKG
jgi:nitroimidazol reductase NimA-like FMN-containing flavoprotein (pyridoxamine 5'-phosphate oxidase superfamily)